MTSVAQWPATTYRELDPRDKAARYYGAVVRFLLAIMKHNEEVAMELANEFAVRFLEGRYEHFDPERGGRFRDYLKECLRNLVRDYWRNVQRRREQPLPDSSMPLPIDVPSQAFVDDEFAKSFRMELISRAYAALAEHEKIAGTPYYAVMLVRTEGPNRAKKSAELVEPLSARLGRPLTTNNVRQLVHRARLKFAELLLEEVRYSLGEATDEELERELLELSLFEYCKPMLAL